MKGFLATCVVAISALVAIAAPVPTHLFPREAETVVPGLVFAWTADGERWVVRGIGLDGRAVCYRVGGKSHGHPFKADEVRKAHHFGMLLTPPEDEP